MGMQGDNRTLLLNLLADRLWKNKTPDIPYIVGITGIDTSGKTELSKALYQTFQTRKVDVQIIHLDDFHHPKAIRYCPGVSEPQQYYKQSFDFERLIDEVLDPIRKHNGFQGNLLHLDLTTDARTVRRRYSIHPDTIVLLEGVFLFRSEVRPHVDFYIYLDVNEDNVMKRAMLRDVPSQGNEVLRKYANKYLPAQKEYLTEHPPMTIADVVVNNCDWDNPQIIKWPGEEGEKCDE
ncbi:MAG: hypothetical protein J7639_08510 [Paenibacillaceae bacterium]|nr:hypothetical protein [Paenibacillaceae bacterium]